MRVVEIISILYNILFFLRFWLIENSYNREFVIGGLIGITLHILWGCLEISNCLHYYRANGRSMKSELKCYQGVNKSNTKNDFPDCLKRYDTYMSYTAYYAVVVIGLTICGILFRK